MTERVQNTGSVQISGLYVDYRESWLATHDEPVLDVNQLIIDAHHHLWMRPASNYMFDEYRADVDSGHNIVSSVYVDCRSMYRADGPPAFRTVGEVEFANGIAAMSASGGFGKARIAAAIIGHVPLTLGAGAQAPLEALIQAGGQRFKGIRQVTAWDADPQVMQPIATRLPHLLTDESFRKGFACLAPLGLSFDAFVLHPQLPELESLAQKFSDTPIVIDHVGGFVGVGSFAARRDEEFKAWASSMTQLSKLPNVSVKLGGLGMRMFGFGFHEQNVAPGSEQLALAWKPFFETCVQTFGPSRCMFESNFPPDKGSCTYRGLWNAFKRLAAGYSAEEKHDLFYGSAARFYRMEGYGAQPTILDAR